MGDRENDLKDNPPREGHYANYLQIGFNCYEFVLDFGQNFADNGAPFLHSRIITSPTYLKYLLETVNNSLNRYERDFGVIQTDGSSGHE